MAVTQTRLLFLFRIYSLFIQQMHGPLSFTYHFPEQPLNSELERDIVVP